MRQEHVDERAGFVPLDYLNNSDTETETLMQQALDVLLANQTSLVIAHRLSTIRRADTILVLHRGQLIEQGSHETLLQNDRGHYAQLHALQYGST